MNLLRQRGFVLMFTVSEMYLPDTLVPNWLTTFSENNYVHHLLISVSPQLSDAEADENRIP